jgi:hypothetical protein
MIVVGYYGNIKVATYRKTKRDAYINADRTTVKLIMSKMEIMQSDNNQKELHKISEEFDTIKSARIEESR